MTNYCSDCYYCTKLIKSRRGVILDGECTCPYNKYIDPNNKMEYKVIKRCSYFNGTKSYGNCHYFIRKKVFKFNIFGNSFSTRLGRLGRFIQTEEMKRRRIEWERMRTLEEMC